MTSVINFSSESNQIIIKDLELEAINIYHVMRYRAKQGLTIIGIEFLGTYLLKSLFSDAGSKEKN